MRRTLSFLLCALISAAVFAQKGADAVPSVPMTQLGVTSCVTPSERPLNVPQRKAVVRRATSPVTTQPEGVLHDGLTRSSLSLTTSLGKTTDNIVYDGKVCKWVEGSDGNVYIFDPVVAYHTGAWVQGEWGGRGASGDTIYVTGPQLAYTETYAGYFTYNYYADRMEKKSGTWAAAASDHKTMFIWRNDSLIQPRQTNVAYGFVNESGESHGLLDHYSVARPMTDKLVEPSSEQIAQAREMIMRSFYSYTDTTWNSRTVKMIVDEADNAIYLQNISDACPEAWIKGDIEGDKVTFPNGQYLGIYEDQQYYAYLSGVKTTRTWWDEGEYYYYSFDLTSGGLVFTYDKATGTLSNDDGGFSIMPGATAKYYISYCLHPSIVPITGEAKAPAAPTFVRSYAYGFGEWSEAMAPFLSLQFQLPTFSDDGTYLDPEKMSYVVYLDTMRYELQPDEYNTLTESMTEIPYDFTDNYYFYKSGMSRAFYLFEDCDSLGIQSIYTDGDKKLASPVSYFDMSKATAYTASKSASYYDGTKLAWGTTPTGKRETYDVAKFMGTVAEIGQQVEGVRVKLGDAHATVVKAWAAKKVKTPSGELTLQHLENAEVVATTDQTEGEIVFTFSNPVVITNEGLYVGYSFQIDEPDGDNISPVSLLKNEMPDGFWCHTTRTYRHWRDLSYYGVLDMDVTLGDVPDNAAKLSAISSTPVKIGEAPQVTFTLVNVGNNGVQDFEYTYEVAGKTCTQAYDMGNKPVGSTLGDSATATIALPADIFTTGGAYPFTLTITKVNGEDNAVSAQDTAEILIYATLPHHRSVEEEYTGTWCGWCPRGLVALEMMNERYPDDFIAISYHNDDPMEIDAEFPSTVSGFPKAWVDRAVVCDPYYGTSGAGFGIESVWKTRTEEIAPADVSLKAYMDETQSYVRMDAEITFPITRENAHYNVEYVLLHDSLCGTSSSWLQKNYYAQSPDSDPNLSDLSSKGAAISGLNFNDVIVATSRQSTDCIPLPLSVVMGVPLTDSFTFKLSKVVSTSGESLVQNVKNLRAVMLLVDAKTGQIVNAAKSSVVSSTGISAATANDEDFSTAPAYDISGRKVSSSYHGVIVQGGRKIIRR